MHSIFREITGYGLCIVYNVAQCQPWFVSFKTDWKGKLFKTIIFTIFSKLNSKKKSEMMNNKFRVLNIFERVWHCVTTIVWWPHCGKYYIRNKINITWNVIFIAIPLITYTYKMYNNVIIKPENNYCSKVFLFSILM